ncbi:hypothetical protein I350_08258 [Cryptococcus amylolentus CBS 6273]|uniref:FAD-binding FR-type domain-containing protein n=1 Tax=Cryptococcus amylolentus CBS 6273 TaxID=1296118 RepID=A0A1E3J6G2_9TREE|nr:hypothetical protein I350_08258 [Cryptococcus amylolentus CBS 6273]
MTELGAKRIGERGEGDDDKSLEEDYLAWKDPMWTAFSKRRVVEEGGAGDVADFVVKELPDHAPEKAYHGQFSPRALLASASGGSTPVGAYGAKNPFPAPVLSSRELFSVGGNGNCVHIEFDITGSGMNYQHGDHVGVWPSNPDVDVDRSDIVDIESLDPALGKAPFPSPATYDAIFRHYLDISAMAFRQTIAFLARYAPTEAAGAKLTQWDNDKEAYAKEVDGPALKLAEVLQAASGDSVEEPFAPQTVWSIPFDRIVSSIPRLQLQYYSISSSAKFHPNAIHVTAVVLKYPCCRAPPPEPRWVFGLSTNFVLNVKLAQSGENAPSAGDAAQQVTMKKIPQYSTGWRALAAIMSRETSTESLSTCEGALLDCLLLPRFQSSWSVLELVLLLSEASCKNVFVALTCKAIEKNGPDALKDWAHIYLFYGCRRAGEEFCIRTNGRSTRKNS